MDTEFDFPPDNAVEYLADEPLQNDIPLNALVSTPIEQLPPTQPPGGVGRSLRQTIRGVGARLHPPRYPRTRAGSQQDSSARGGGATAASGAGNAPLLSSRSAVGSNSSTPGITPLDPSQGPLGSSFYQNGSAAAQDEFALDVQPSLGDGADPPMRTAPAATQPLSGVVSARLTQGRRGRADWTEAEVQRFYAALSQYGTDFAAIAILFPEHTREEVKRLYHRELRRHQNLVRQALANRQTIDLDTFTTLLEEKEKKERKPAKALNTEEEDMLSRIALGAASPSTTAAEEHAPDNTHDGGVSGDRKRLAKRSRENSPGAEGGHNKSKTKKDKSKKKRKNDVSGGGEDGGKEETFYETAMRLMREGEAGVVDRNKEDDFGEFDFDDMHM